MRVVLDGSVVYDTQGAAFKYFQGIVPRLREHGDLRIDVLPSPSGVLENRTGRDPLSRARRKAGAVLRRWRLRAASNVLFHSYYYTLPPVDGWPQVQLVHDLIAEKFESELQSENDRAFRARKRECFARARHFIAVSENTKRDLCSLFSLPDSKVDVVPQGIDAAYFAAPISPARQAQVLRECGIDRPYFLQVGGRMHHKNFARAVEAFASGGFAKDMRLVCAGEVISAEEEAVFARWGVKEAIRAVRWPSEDTLRVLLRGAKGLVYPSLYEGFGVPPLEAMASGIPVAASQAASIPEVCGEAATFFDPLDAEAIARALQRLLEPATARALVERGRDRVKLFSWRKVAERTAAVYRKIGESLAP